MTDRKNDSKTDFRLALPKGRMYAGVLRLLEDAGVRVRESSRDYRPSVTLADCTAKILKPQNVVSMLDAGARDVGFAGADWVAESGADLVEMLDTGLDPVRLVAAAPVQLLKDGRLPDRRLRVATEYRSLAGEWIERRGIDATILRTFGATEVFPPEDADCIVDNTATGATLRANGLEIVDALMASSTRLYASPAAMRVPEKRERIEELAMLLQSVLEARRRVMIDLNVAADALSTVIERIPCMREPTVSPLHNNGWYAVRAAAPRELLPTLIPELRAAGARDIVTSVPSQIIL